MPPKEEVEVGKEEALVEPGKEEAEVVKGEVLETHAVETVKTPVGIEVQAITGVEETQDRITRRKSGCRE